MNKKNILIVFIAGILVISIISNGLVILNYPLQQASPRDPSTLLIGTSSGPIFPHHLFLV
jgi:hypothetical protein